MRWYVSFHLGANLGAGTGGSLRYDAIVEWDGIHIEDLHARCREVANQEDSDKNKGDDDKIFGKVSAFMQKASKKLDDMLSVKVAIDCLTKLD